MPAQYTLGRNYTVSGLTGATDLTFTQSGERIDVSTRAGSKPYKHTIAGFPDKTFECSVYAKVDTVFSIGKAYAVTINGTALGDMICMNANREEPGDGIVTYRLTLKPGLESEVDNQTPIGPGSWRQPAAN